MLPMMLALSGVLVTYSRGSEIGRERFVDDGKSLKSEIVLAGQKATVTLHRGGRQAVVEAEGKTLTRIVPPGTVALENGQWQAYAFAAEQHPEAREPTTVKILLPASGITVDGKLRVTTRPDRTRRVELTTASLQVMVEVAANGIVTRASVPAQELEVLPEGTPPPAPPKRPPPEGVAEEAIEIGSGGIKVRGSLWRPVKATGRIPLALLIAGSGPTDRDGNAKGGILRTDCYRLLAEYLAGQGVASIRYDKRGIGASDAVKESTLTIDDYVADAAALIGHAKSDGRFSKITVIGHSEGGLVALLVAQKTPIDALILLSTAGRPFGQVLHEQLARQHQGAQLAALDEILSALRDGKPIKQYPPEVAALFRPSIEKFLRSEIATDPAALLARLTVPTAIVQGETDVQVSVDDARRLGQARKDAHLVVLPRINHVLKEEAACALPQASYLDPTRPLGPGLSEAVLKAIAR